MITPEDVMSALNSSWEGVPEPSGNPKWTAAVKKALAKLGKNHGLHRGSSPIENTEELESHEWLWDLTLYSEDKIHEPITFEGRTWHPLRRLHLVCESEWRGSTSLPDHKYYDHVRYDFEKIVAARADLKLMVLEAKDRDKAEDFVKLLYRHAAAFRPALLGDHYMFAVWEERRGDTPTKFHYWSYEVGCDTSPRELK